MVRPKQSEQHPNLPAAIKETARKQIAKKGAAALSLRAIARGLKITAPAIYNYFPSRDDLVTALIVDAFNSLGDVLRASQEGDTLSHTERIMASAQAYRTWALTHPEEYHLIFGTPIPNYHAPAEITGPAAAGNMMVLIEVLDAAWRAGAIDVAGRLSFVPGIIQAWAEKFEYPGPPEVIHFAMACWAQIHGLVSLELNGQFSSVPVTVSTDDFFEVEIRAMLARMGA